jgi:hypothetical protein
MGMIMVRLPGSLTSGKSVGEPGLMVAQARVQPDKHLWLLRATRQTEPGSPDLRIRAPEGMPTMPRPEELANNPRERQSHAGPPRAAFRPSGPWRRRRDPDPGH